jgi:hypothetical protein
MRATCCRKLPNSDDTAEINMCGFTGRDLKKLVANWALRTLYLCALLDLRGHIELDKIYSLCNAVSFVLMREQNLIDALTTDRHFEQAGFRRARLSRPIRLADLCLAISLVLPEMQLRGIADDSDDLETMGEEFSQRKAEVEQAIYEMAGSKFNIGSTKQLATVLLENLKSRHRHWRKLGRSPLTEVHSAHLRASLCWQKKSCRRLWKF